MLARWLRYREQSEKKPLERRPILAEKCDNLHEAEKWRGQIIREISKNVREIQNATLGEHVIRDLNDKINKLLREKRHWEKRITQLGGIDYTFSFAYILCVCVCVCVCVFRPCFYFLQCVFFLHGLRKFAIKFRLQKKKNKKKNKKK